jgi:hypothetical protein
LSIAEEHGEIVAIACGGTLTVPRLRQLAREIEGRAHVKTVATLLLAAWPEEGRS